MAGFRPQGLSVPGAFTRNTNSSNGSTFKQNPKTRLCTVDGYDVSRSIMFATDDKTQEKLEVKVADKDVQRNLAREQSNPTAVTKKWSGFAIDARMEENVPVGDKVVIERGITVKKVTANGVDTRLIDCTWVHHITVPNPEKTFHGKFTISSFQGRVTNVQHWGEQAIGLDDEPSLEGIATELDTNKTAHDNKENRPGLGVQFRVVVPKELKAGEEEKDRVWEVIDSSPPFDWVQAEKDAAGNVVRTGHPLDGAKFTELINGYYGYIYGDEQNPPKFDEATLAAAKVEVMTYVSYLASQMSTAMLIPDRQFDPLYQMANTRTKYAQDDTEFVVGKNWAVDGILSLSDDKAPKVRGEDWTKRDLATRLFADNLKLNVHRFVATSTGNRAMPHPAIERVRDDLNQDAAGPAQTSSQPAAGGSLATPPRSQPAARPASAPSLVAPAADPFAQSGADPFLAAAQNAAPLDAPAADPFAEVSEPAAPAAEAAPVAEPATPAAGETAAAPAARRPGFSRRQV